MPADNLSLLGVQEQSHFVITANAASHNSETGANLSFNNNTLTDWLLKVLSLYHI